MKAPPIGDCKRHSWLILIGLLVLAATLRLVFFNGAFGSDDLVYLNRSVQISEGVWSSANYNGALRYGFNIPAGFFIYLFGANILAANLWPLLCSLIEIAATYFFAFVLWGKQVALYATLMLVFMPLHVASATRIHADPVVACFLTLSFVVFYFAEQKRSRWLYFFCGINMGLVFWAKELAVVTLFAFLLYPLVLRKFDVRWIYVVYGGLIMLLGHFILMLIVSGDHLHALKIVLNQMRRSFIFGMDPAEDGAWYYFKYLFVDVKHIWIAGGLATFSVFAFVVNRQRLSVEMTYVVFWLLALIGVLSFLPVSLSPLKLVMKQSNYLTLFLTPLALLAGYSVSLFPTSGKAAVLVFTLVGGLILAGLEQQAYRIFTSNSKAAVEFSKLHVGMPIFGSNNNGNIAAIYAIFDGNRSSIRRFRYMSELPHHDVQEASAMTVFVLLDFETMTWGKDAVILERAPACWKMVEALVPTGFGLSQSLIHLFDLALELVPHAIRYRLKLYIEEIEQPRPAFVYEANLSNFWCEQ